jgi:intein-encoded DNA endonuclease-like protein
MTKITIDLENEILNDYHSGLTKTQIKIKHNISLTPINRIFKKNNITYAKNAQSHIRERSIGWNLDFFEKNSPNLAYIAGFLFADGCLKERILTNDKTYNLSVSLNEKDLNIIEFICDCIGLSYDKIRSIPARRGDPQKMICIGHKNLGQLMDRWGIIPNKTYNFKAPEINDELLPHFIRGWIDGDGTIKVRYRKSSYIRITGNKKALEWFIENSQRLAFEGKIYKTEWHEGKVWGKIIIQNRTNMAWFKKTLLCNDFFCVKRKWDVIPD